MARIFLSSVFRIVFWTYQRGSWQYDLICILILAFIFLTPKTVFDGTAFLREGDPATIEEEDQQPRGTRAAKSSTEGLESADFRVGIQK